MNKLIKAMCDEIISEEILRLFFISIRFAQILNYTKANDYYLKLASGQCQWLNEDILNQGNKRKRYHLVNEDLKRKYIQTYKRLITISQSYQ